MNLLYLKKILHHSFYTLTQHGFCFMFLIYKVFISLLKNLIPKIIELKNQIIKMLNGIVL